MLIAPAKKSQIAKLSQAKTISSVNMVTTSPLVRIMGKATGGSLRNAFRTLIHCWDKFEDELLLFMLHVLHAVPILI